jgi:hypothetical protein
MEDSEMITHEQKESPAREGGSIDRRWVGGVALVALGAVMLIGQFANSAFTGTLILPALAIVFLAWGIATRHAGPMVPAGIFIGLSLGTWLMLSDWITEGLSEEARGGVFLLAFALGWASICALTFIFAKELHWWPLIPAGIMALIGGALLVGGTALQALTWLGYVWPIGLVALGLLLLLRRGEGRREP